MSYGKSEALHESLDKLLSKSDSVEEDLGITTWFLCVLTRNYSVDMICRTAGVDYRTSAE